jgi:hypothetical protein
MGSREERDLAIIRVNCSYFRISDEDTRIILNQYHQNSDLKKCLDSVARLLRSRIYRNLEKIEEEEK